MGTTAKTFGATIHHEWFTGAGNQALERLIMTLHTVEGVKRAKPQKFDDEVLLSIELDCSHSLDLVIARVTRVIHNWAEKYQVSRRSQQS